MTGYAALLDELVSGTLDVGSFGHVDHIGVAYAALARHTYFDALQIVATGIDRAARKAGAENKFNATITSAFMSLIAERMGQGTYKNPRDFIDRNPDLVSGAPLAALFSRARLTSDQARRVALLPDLVQDGSRQRLTIG